MEDGGVDNTSNVRAIRRRTRKPRIGRETGQKTTDKKLYSRYGSIYQVPKWISRKAVGMSVGWSVCHIHVLIPTLTHVIIPSSMNSFRQSFNQVFPSFSQCSLISSCIHSFTQACITSFIHIELVHLRKKIRSNDFKMDTHPIWLLTTTCTQP